MDQPIRNSHGESLDYSYTPGSSEDGPLIVIGHGVTANKDRTWAVELAEGLAAAGLASLRFSFSGNGESDGDFRESTVTKEVKDLGAVLDTVGQRPIVYVGHSMGGAVGVLRTASDPRIVRLISLAGMVHTATFARRKFGEQVPGKDLMWGKPECPLSQTFVDDMNKVRSVMPFASRVIVPWLLIHGTADSVVPFQDSVEIRDAAGTNAELVSLEQADHLFTGQEQAVARIVVAWLERDHGNSSAHR